MSVKIWISNYDYAGLVGAFRALGWQVLCGPRRNWWAWAHGWEGSENDHKIEIPKTTPAEFSAFFRREMIEHRPDIVLLGKGYDSNVSTESCKPKFWHVLPDDLKFARDRGAAIVYLTLDDPNDFGMFGRTSLPDHCDAIGTCCIDTRDAYRAYTNAHVFEWWPAWDLTRIVQTRREYKCDLAIVGSPYLSPVDRADGDMSGPSISRRTIAAAAIEAGYKVKIWGPDSWLERSRGGDPDLRSVFQGWLPGHENHNVFATAAVTYNSFVRYARRYANDRIFLVLGAGGVLLSESQLLLPDAFPEIVWHKRGDVDDFLVKLRSVSKAKTRTKLAVAGQHRVLAEHTYVERANTIAVEYAAIVERRRARSRR